MHPVEITGPRVTLREYAPGDAAAVHAFATHPDIFVGDPDQAPGLDMFEAMLRQRIEVAAAADRQSYELAVVVDGQMIGSCTLSGLSPAHRRADIGYIVHPDWWGKGYATEASTLLLRFGFDQLGLHRIEAGTATDNAGSQRVLEKIGMTYEGLAREYARIGGQWRDSMQYAILDRDLPA